MGYFIKKHFFAAILLSSCCHLFSSNDEIDLDSLKQDFAGINFSDVQQVVDDLKIDETNAKKERCKILWSIPKAFPNDVNLDANIQDLHMNIPFWGKISLNDIYESYTTKLTQLRGKTGFNKCEPVLDQLERLDDDCHIQINSISDKAPDIANFHIPGLSWYKYLKGTRIPGIGLYKEDLKELSFLASSLATEYVLFKDIKNNKMNKTKDFLLANKNEFVILLETLENAKSNAKKDPKTFKETQIALHDFIVKNCSLFGYNPLKREIIVPIIKYLFLQRVVENLKENKYAHLQRGPNESCALTEDATGKLVESAVTPISIVTLSKILIFPMLSFSEVLKTHVNKAITSLRFTDKVFGNLKLPNFCYSKDEAKTGLPLSFYNVASSSIGESAVCIMSIKILDRYFNNHLVNALIKNSKPLLEALKDNIRLNSLEVLDEGIAEQIKESDTKLEKLIESSSLLNQTGVNSWFTAKRQTFLKIGSLGFMCFVLPTIAMKAYQIFSVLRQIKSN